MKPEGKTRFLTTEAGMPCESLTQSATFAENVRVKGRGPI